MQVLERLAYAALIACFVVALPVAKTPAVTFPGFREAMFLSSGLASGATAAVLVALWRAKPRSAYLVLAQAYVVTAVASIASIFAFPLSPDGGTMLRANSVPAPYIYLAWHAIFAIVAMVYAGLRWRLRRRAGPVRRRGWVVPFVLPAGLSVAALLTIGALAGRFQHYHAGQANVGGPLLWCNIGVLLALLAPCFAIGRLPYRNYVDAALGLTLAALAVELAFNLLSTERYSLAWSAARLVMFASLTFVLVGTGAELIATYRSAFVLRDRLRIESARSNERSRRMEALWALARDPARDRERIDRIIAEGVRALSGTDGTVRGRLIDADDLVREHDTELLAVTQSEPSVRVSAHPQPSVAASFAVERRTYVLQFTRESPANGFDGDDLVFVQVLSTLCAEIMEAMARRERQQFQSEREMLTGLYNPTVLRSRLVEALRERSGAFLTIRIANLRDIGRSLGRLASDAIVVEIAALLQGEAAAGELVARAGDESFGVLFPALPRETLVARVEAFDNAIRRAFDLGDRSGRAAVDIVPRLRAVIFDAGSDAEAVLTQASFDDDSGFGNERLKIVPYDRSFDRRYAERRDLLAELRAGIERDEILVYYQPYIDLDAGTVVGAEALMRWRHPVRGVLEPAAFMGLAHEWGLMPALGEAVAARVFADIGTMRRANPNVRVYINLDAGGFESAGLVERLLARAHQAGVPPDALGVEITETTAMRDVAAAQAVMEALHRTNIAIALDDFGTGFSSLAYLKQYPVDVIKIDRSFVAGLPENTFDAGLIGAIIAVARAFGMRVHAEGIETPAQAAWLRQNGCSTAQGWYYAKALPIDEFVAYTAMSGAGISAGRT